MGVAVGVQQAQGLTMAKFGPFRLKRDWLGRRVRVRGGCTTRGGDRYPPDTIFVIEAVPPGGFDLRTPACPTCGHSGRVKVSSYHDLELVDDAP